MGRLTKIRSSQTRAKEEYNPSGDNLATDNEVESRVKKNEELFLGNRDENQKMTFDVEGNLTDLRKWDDTDTILLEHNEYVYTNGDLTSITETVWDDLGEEYTKMTKTFLRTNGTVSEIQNRLVS